MCVAPSRSTQGKAIMKLEGSNRNVAKQGVLL
jgi:hypothetical protein